jgi:hypothetical protein
MSPRNPATQISHVASHPKPPVRSKKISPSQYALNYHSLLINDPQQKLFAAVNITRYQNGTRAPCETERNSLLSDRGQNSRGKTPANDLPLSSRTMSSIPPNPFTRKASTAPIGARARPTRSPMSFAWRCDAGGSAKAKRSRPSISTRASFWVWIATAWSATTHGVSPAVSIGVWALGEPGKLLSWSDEETARGRLGSGRTGDDALRSARTPAVQLAEICDGDVLITVTADNHYKHIALVEGITVLGTDRVIWTIVEWGEGGNVNKHIKAPTTVKLEQGKNKKFGLGFYQQEAIFAISSPAQTRLGKPAKVGPLRFRLDI